MIKGPIHKKLRILNIYALIDRASKYEPKTYRTKGRNRQIYNDNWRF